jgi:hypothetical protein
MAVYLEFIAAVPAGIGGVLLGDRLGGWLLTLWR